MCSVLAPMAVNFSTVWTITGINLAVRSIRAAYSHPPRAASHRGLLQPEKKYAIGKFPLKSQRSSRVRLRSRF
jgi:hypothetical protein